VTKVYDTTDLDPLATFERHVFHRDQFAHYLRWTHVLREAKIGDKVVDFGCGRGNLLEVLYRNRFKPGWYVGMDIREKTIASNIERFAGITGFPVRFLAQDLIEPTYDLTALRADKVCSFEVLEHVGKQNVDQFLANFKRCGRDGATYYLSTPNYDPQVGAADNHTYDSGDGRGVQPQEWGHAELGVRIDDAGFKVVAKYGTFASQKDYKKHLTPAQAEVFKQLHAYYDANLVSNIMAPIVDASLARNCLWVLQ
jgi:SAM-dependent methyltransferase